MSAPSAEHLRQYNNEKLARLRSAVETAIATYAAHQIYVMREHFDLPELMDEIQADMIDGINACNAEMDLHVSLLPELQK